MKRLTLSGIVFILICFCSPPATGVPLDCVVMVDTSNSMAVYFDDLVQYISSQNIKRMTLEDSTLEDIFLTYYKDELDQGAEA